MWSPPSLPGYAFYACNRPGRLPSHEIGCVRLSDDALALWMIRMTSTEDRLKLQSALPLVLSADEPGAALAVINNDLCDQTPRSGNVAEICIAVLNAADHTLTIAAAGSFLPVLRTPQGQIIELDRSQTGVPLGVAPSMEYATQVVRLTPKTSVLWISPYTLHVLNSSDAIYPLRRYHVQLKLAPSEPGSMVEFIANDISDYTGQRGKDEDMCIIAFQRVD